jgi:hypothetical protein
VAGLDAEMLELILSTLGKGADKKLTLAYRLALDRIDKFPHAGPQEPYDSNTIGLQLWRTSQEYGELAAAKVHRMWACSNPPFGTAGVQRGLPARLFRDSARLVGAWREYVSVLMIAV